MKNFYWLIQGDCLEVLPTLPNDFVDLIVIDPPYGQTDFKWDKFEEWEILFTEFKRILKDNGQMFVFGKLPMLYEVYRYAIDSDFIFRYEIIWVKNHPAPYATSKKPLQAHENILCFAKKKCKISSLTFNLKDIMINTKPSPRWGSQKKNLNRLRTGWRKDIDVKEQRKRIKSFPRTVINASIVHPFHLPDEYRGHPTQKPERIIRWIVQSSSNIGEIVLDSFLGSGTTMKVCQDLSRSCIGIEIVPEYCEITKKRCFGRTFLDREVEYKFEVFK